MATGAEIAVYIINGVLPARKYATKRVERFTKKEIAIPRSKFLWSHTMHYHSNDIEKRETEKGNICPQRRPLGCWIIC